MLSRAVGMNRVALAKAYRPRDSGTGKVPSCSNVFCCWDDG